jgi:hypothetical protein
MATPAGSPSALLTAPVVVVAGQPWRHIVPLLESFALAAGANVIPARRR